MEMKPGNERHLDPSERKGIPPEEFEKDLEYMKNHPLFMKEIPADMSTNPELMALQHVLYNDTPENLAVHFNVPSCSPSFNKTRTKGMNTQREFLKVVISSKKP